jgi:hypothetical protein
MSVVYGMFPADAHPHRSPHAMPLCHTHHAKTISWRPAHAAIRDNEDFRTTGVGMVGSAIR